MTIEQFVEKVRQAGFRAEQRGGEYRAQCPAHGGQDLNLAIGPGEGGRVLCTCHSHHCTAEEIATAVGASIRDLMPERTGINGSGLGKELASYPYRNETGQVLYWVGRFGGKEFRQWRAGAQGERIWGLGNVRRVLFGLPELLASAPGETIAIVEGEKDAIAVASLGVAATTNAMGAGKWRQEYTDWLKQHLPDRKFVVLPDNDEPGIDHADAVCASLKRAGLECRVVGLPGLGPKGDVSDWIKAGGTAEQLQELLRPPRHPLLDRLLSRDQVRNLPPHAWQIEGLFFEQSIVEIYSEPNQGKTLLAMDIGLNMVRGGAWADHAIVTAGPVIYVNSDGGPGFSPRLRAWEMANGTDALYEFWTHPQELLIADAAQMQEFTDGLGELPEAPGLLIIDTLSQCIPGVNENQQEDMSRVVGHLNAIKRRYGTTVMLLHHVGKDGLNRGSTVIPGAADTIIRISQQPGDLIEMRCDKQRDGRKFAPLYFQIASHGADQGVYLVQAAGPSGSPAAREEREQQVIDSLRLNGAWLTREEVRARTLGISAASVYRYLRKLAEEGILVESERPGDGGRRAKVYRYNQAADGAVD